MRRLLVLALALGGCADAVEGADDWRRLGEGALGADAGPSMTPLGGRAGEVPGDGSDDGPEGIRWAGAPPVSTVGDVQINEVAAAGDPADWFELFNIDDHPVDLSGWTFTDDLDGQAPGPGTFPLGTVLAPGAFLWVEVGDEATGFKLGKDESLVLFDARGLPVDALDWAEGESPAGGSLARMPDGIGGFETVDAPSPGHANSD